MTKINSSFTYNKKKLGKKSKAKSVARIEALLAQSLQTSTGEVTQKLSPAERKFMRDDLIANSPKLDTIPEYIYHASPMHNHESILAQGLQVSAIFSDIYFAESPSAATQFVRPPCMIYQVATKHLQHAVLRESLDHNPYHFSGKCFVYFNPVPMKHIVAATLFEG